MFSLPSFSMTTPEAGVPEKILVWQKLSSFSSTLTLIERSLELTSEAQSYQVAPSLDIDEASIISEAEAGDSVQVVSLMPTKESVKRLRPIYIPVARGLYGLRICLIAKAHQSTFQNYESIEEMKRVGVEFVVPRGSADESLLQKQGLKTVAAERYEDLFGLISNQTPRCFLRNLSEIGLEALKFFKYNIHIEKKFLFVLDEPRILHVSPAKKDLAERLEKGMKMLLESGEFYKIFWKYHHSHFRSYNTKNRKRVFLSNDQKMEPIESFKKEPKMWLPSYYKETL